MKPLAHNHVTTTSTLNNNNDSDFKLNNLNDWWDKQQQIHDNIRDGKLHYNIMTALCISNSDVLGLGSGPQAKPKKSPAWP